MTSFQATRLSFFSCRFVLELIALMFIAQSFIGLSWGLPSTQDTKLRPANEAGALPGPEFLPGSELLALVQGERGKKKFSPGFGADVDVDPLDVGAADRPIPLTENHQAVAAIELRYRLYSHQPDEMITFMALAGMKPSRLQFDPKLYQYGGLFIYPVGALLKACDLLGFVEVRQDLAYYLDHPDQFGRFYIVARLYSALWGIAGIFVVYGIARRLSGVRAGLMAALLFALLPSVVCMAHEGKPHLPGAVLMLAGVLLAMRHLGIETHAHEVYTTDASNKDHALKRSRVDFFFVFRPFGELMRLLFGKTARAKARGSLSPESSGAPIGEYPISRQFPRTSWDWFLACALCGAAVGMVLSSAPIIVLIPLMVWMEARKTGNESIGKKSGKEAGKETVPAIRVWTTTIRRTLLGCIIAVLVYLVTNPYVVISTLTNREVLRSNFGNSLAMYEIARFGEGLIRVFELTLEGASLPVTLLGLTALGVAVVIRRRDTLPLVIPAVVFTLQFVLIGAGKPGEYGRFGVFTNTALAIGTACLLMPERSSLQWTRWLPRKRSEEPRVERPRGLKPAAPGNIPINHTFLSIITVIWCVACSSMYLWNFHADTTSLNTRTIAAAQVKTLLAQTEPSRVRQDQAGSGRAESDNNKPDNNQPEDNKIIVAVPAVPAPYGCPRLDFADVDMVLFPGPKGWASDILPIPVDGYPTVLVRPVDRLTHSFRSRLWPFRVHRISDKVTTTQITTTGPTNVLPSPPEGNRSALVFETEISWANKPFEVLLLVEPDPGSESQ